ncbi:hypothetical protein [Rheinheimera texasensis]|jgi:hypothetical protein|uniref:hypothetical protein n=1 Tax=Rheinheimera texasensis TaxID=306205 RepID=UPI0004E1090E|nr:hypothetical protein [Rheinheimera texasensis]
MKTEQQLDAMISQLAPALEPQRDLWPDISARLEPRQRRGYGAWLGVAAAAVLTLWFWPQQLVQVPQLAQNGPVAVSNEPQVQQAEAQVPMANADVSLLAVSEQLSRQLNEEQTRQLKALQKIPDGFSDWSQQIAIWNKAQAQIELALAFQPDNQKLIQQLQRLQQQQLSYIAKLVETSELT